MVAGYCHNGRIGVVVELIGVNLDLGKDLAMHIAASKPEVVNPEDLSEETVAKEKEIFIAQAQQSGKSLEIAEKMVVGKIKKFVNEMSLVGQPFVKDPAKTVKDLLQENNINVARFIRFEVGEGVEKEEKDFAAEVKAQVEGKS
jgi:elongation factor Ts